MATKIKENILKLLDERDITVNELERQAGLKKSAIRNILQDKSRNPTYSTLQAIAKELGCNVDSLAGGQDSSLKISQSKTTNIDFMHEAINEIKLFIDEHDIAPTSANFINCLQEVHDYAVDNKLDHIDKRFLKWSAKRKLINQKN